jgi:hypothetical protein
MRPEENRRQFVTVSGMVSTSSLLCDRVMLP